MARYNSWQNDVLIKATSLLNNAERQKDRGAFFGSIQNTFSHILWGDQIWLSRFSSSPAPKGDLSESSQLYSDWNAFVKERSNFDKILINWSKNVEPSWFAGDLSWYSGAVGHDVTKPKSLLVLQLFNHQTHHRGQIHTMLTAAGIKTDDTDIPFMPERYERV